MRSNNGRMFITLKPREERSCECRSGHRAPAAPARQGPGRAGCSCRRRRTCASAAARRARSIQYTLQGSDIEQLNEWAPKMLAKLKSLPELRDVATDQQTEGTTLTLTINRDQASRYGLTPQTDRRHALRRLRPAPDRAIFHPAVQLLRDHGGAAVAAGRSRDARPDLPAIADDGRPGAAVGLRQMDDDADPAAVDQPSGPVPGDHHQLQSGAGRGARSGDGRDRAGQGRVEHAGDHQHDVPGQCAGVPGFALDRADADHRGARSWSISSSAFSTRATSIR